MEEENVGCCDKWDDVGLISKTYKSMKKWQKSSGLCAKAKELRWGRRSLR